VDNHCGSHSAVLIASHSELPRYRRDQHEVDGRGRGKGRARPLSASAA